LTTAAAAQKTRRSPDRREESVHAESPHDVPGGDPGNTYKGKHKYGVWVRGGNGLLGGAVVRADVGVRALDRASTAPRGRPPAGLRLAVAGPRARPLPPPGPGPEFTVSPSA